MKAFILCIAILSMIGCNLASFPPPPPGGGGDGGSGAAEPVGGASHGGAGGGTTIGSGGNGPCVCEALPECADPDNFTAWCGAYGPGPFGAVRCTGCDESECAIQIGPIPVCLDAPLWCCGVNFNPPPVPTEHYCEGTVMCEVAPAVFSVLCSYEENVTAIDPVAAAQVLLAKCQAEHKDTPCGLWTLECFAAE